MASDPAFIFYPGDYLRDTQCLSEKSQVAYDRIMCEHMRNICISKQQLKFFTKRLSEDEAEELLMVLTEVEGGYQIRWVAESIEKRRAYSESRRKNRTKKKEKDVKNISKTYVHHMDNEIEIENKDLIKNEKSKYHDHVFKCYDHCIKFFDKKLIPNTEPKKQKWLADIEKLHRIDELSYEEIIKIVKFTRENPFWSKNFNSLLKLRKNNPEDVAYWLVFKNQMKPSQNKSKPFDNKHVDDKEAFEELKKEAQENSKKRKHEREQREQQERR